MIQIINMKSIGILFLCISLTAASGPCKTTGTSCVRDCIGLPTGDYQSCNDCQSYVTCVHGRMIDDRPCADNVYWDDSLKYCNYHSTTCQCIRTTPETTTTVVTTSTTPAALISMDGEWGMWQPYSDCSKTCGSGSKTRMRYCDSPAPENGGSNCVGLATQNTVCNEYICPDCNKVCSTGTLNTECTLCECTEVINGRVRSEMIGVAGVEIRAVDHGHAALTVTDNQGYFTISGLCADSLLLVPLKDGYESSAVSYQATSNSPVLITLSKLERPSVEVDPVAQTAYSGTLVTLNCVFKNADTAEWFKDNVLLGFYALAGQTTELRVTSDGSYKCRGSNKAGKTFSSEVAVNFISNLVDDTCGSVQPNVVTLPPTCHYLDGSNNQQTSLDIGTCGEKPCISKDTTNERERCCVGVTSEQVEVTCDGFSYKQVKVTQCGCSSCPGIRSVSVFVTLVGDNYNPYSDYVNIVFPASSNLVVDVDPTGAFSFVHPLKKTITFTLTGSNIMNQIGVVDTQEGVSEYYVTVELVSRPAAQIVQPSVGGQVDLISPAGLSTAATLEFPDNAFQLSNGSPYLGEVKVYATFTDPRDKDSMAAAAAQFVFLDEEGTSRNLQSFGVATVIATTNTGMNLKVTGQLKMSVDTDALGITSVAGPYDAVLWTVDDINGVWQKYGDFDLEQARRRRKRDLATIVNGTIELPNNTPWINIDKIIRERRCYLSLNVYLGSDFTTPLLGEMVSVNILDPVTGNFVSRLVKYTHSSGRVCTGVFCDMDVVVTLPGAGSTVVHPTHNLPSGYNFTNYNNGFRTHIVSPLDMSEEMAGPIHRDYHNCENSMHYFMIGKEAPRLSDYGQLSVVEPTPNKTLSFQPGGPPYQACAVSIGIETDDRELRVMGSSFNFDGDLYGTFLAKLRRSHYEAMVSNVACMLTRCPGSNQTDVDIQIISKYRANCTRTSLSEAHVSGSTSGPGASGSTYGSTRYVTAGQASLKLRVNDFSILGPYGQSLQVATGNDLKMVRARVMRMCEQDSWNLAATYSCFENGTPSNSGQQPGQNQS